MQHDRPWHINTGKPPRGKDRKPVPGETLVEVVWSNGQPSRQSYRIDQLRWELNRGDFSIARSRRA